MLQLNELPEYTDRAVIVDADLNHQVVELQIFNEAGFITKVLLDPSTCLGIRTAMKWAEAKCQSKQRNR